MSSAYFDPAVGGDGTTVSDDASPTTGLARGGHWTRFVPALAQIVAVAQWVLTKAGDVSVSASAAAASASSAASGAAAAASAATAAEAALDQFTDQYLGPKAADPTTDNDGNPLVEGALYTRTTAPKGLRVYDGAAWVVPAASSLSASAVAFTPAGSISATNVQAAIESVDSSIAAAQKSARLRIHFLGGA